jgi:hypothetical protein
MRLLRRSMGTAHAAAAFSSRYPQEDEIALELMTTKAR